MRAEHLTCPEHSDSVKVAELRRQTWVAMGPPFLAVFSETYKQERNKAGCLRGHKGPGKGAQGLPGVLMASQVSVLPSELGPYLLLLPVVLQCIPFLPSSQSGCLPCTTEVTSSRPLVSLPETVSRSFKGGILQELAQRVTISSGSCRES